MNAQRNAQIFYGSRKFAFDLLKNKATFYPFPNGNMPEEENGVQPNSAPEFPFNARNIQKPPKTSLRSSFVARLTELIELNMEDENYDINRLCRDAGASRSQIHNKLKKWTGLSTSLFIRTIRLKKAKELLVHTDLNISQVAFEVGFKDYRYFSRVFNGSFGQCPKDYRRQQQASPTNFS